MVLKLCFFLGSCGEWFYTQALRMHVAFPAVHVIHRPFCLPAIFYSKLKSVCYIFVRLQSITLYYFFYLSIHMNVGASLLLFSFLCFHFFMISFSFFTSLFSYISFFLQTFFFILILFPRLIFNYPSISSSSFCPSSSSMFLVLPLFLN